MKTETLFLLLAFCLMSSLNTFAQSSGNYKEVKAIRINTKLIPEFLKAPDIGAYTIDNKGVLRPDKGYHILFFQDSLKLLLKPIKQKSYTLEISHYDEIELPGGHIAACMCWPDPNDNCMFVSEGNPNKFKCKGGCSCGVGILFDVNKSIPEIQTPDGNWNSPR